MIAAALIVLREVFEAALVVGIVLAATRGVAARGRWVTAGLAFGLAGAAAVAAGAEQIAAAVQGVGQDLFNAAVLLCATAMLAWHNIWMKSHGAALAQDMRAVGNSVATGAAPLSMLMIVVGLAVLREGSEVVLFLYGIAAGGTGSAQLLAGSLLGLAGGVAVGAAVYAGLTRVSARQLFAVTGWLLLLLAAGMAAQAAGFLVQAGSLPPLADPVWDSSGWLPERGIPGQLLHALAGYAERPSGMQVVFFAAVMLVLGYWTVRPARNRTATLRAAAPVLLLGVSLAGLSPPARAAHVIYSPNVEEGEVAVEFRGHRESDSSDEIDGAQQYKLEFEYSPTARWNMGVFGEWEREPGESLEAAEIAFENILQLTEQGRHWVDVGLLAEYAHSLEDGGNDALELGLLAEKEISRSLVTANLVAERELDGGAETELEYALRWRLRRNERFEPGLELYGELGEWGEFGSVSHHAHEFGPALFGKLRRADGRGALKYETALLLGLTDVSPDVTVRLLLEYEF